MMNEQTLVGRKVFGQWGIGGGFTYGIITGVEAEYNEVVVKWEEDGETNLGERFYNINDIADENSDLDDIGIHLLPEEETMMEVTIKNGAYCVDIENEEVYNKINGAEVTEQEKVDFIIKVAKRIDKIRKVYKNKIKGGEKENGKMFVLQ